MANKNQKLRITPGQLLKIAESEYFHGEEAIHSIDLKNCTPNGLHVTFNYHDKKTSPKTISMNSDGGSVLIRG